MLQNTAVAADSPDMQFPAFDLEKFRRRIRRLNGTGDACQVLGVSSSTLKRWLAGRQRVPWATWCLVHLLATGDLGGLDRRWTGWSIEAGQLIHGYTAYAPAQIQSYDWYERQNRRLVADLAVMEKRRVPMDTEKARLINTTRATLAKLIEQAQSSHALLYECLSEENCTQSATGTDV